MRTIDEITHNGKTLREILDSHDLWLKGEGGERADLRYADLRHADLYNASLRYANLNSDNLLASGDMRVLRTMQIDTWMIGYTSDTLQIGCQRHAISKWRRWNTTAGRKWIDEMDESALDWADKNLALVLQLIDANPAEKHAGHVEAA